MFLLNVNLLVFVSDLTCSPKNKFPGCYMVYSPDATLKNKLLVLSCHCLFYQYKRAMNAYVKPWPNGPISSHKWTQLELA